MRDVGIGSREDYFNEARLINFKRASSFPNTVRVRKMCCDWELKALLEQALDFIWSRYVGKGSFLR